MNNWPTRDFVAHRADVTPGADALISAASGHTWNYADLNSIVAKLADRLTSALEADQRVGLCAPTRVRAIASVHAAHRIGRPVVLCDPTAPPERLRERVSRTNTGVVITDAANLDSVRSALATSQCQAVCFDRSDASEDSFTTGEPRPRLSSHESLGPSDDALIAFTSGTTGQPSAVRLTLSNLVASAIASAFRLGTSRDDRWLCCLPIHHLGGISIPLRTTLYGSTTVVQRGFDEDETAAIVRDDDVTGLSLVPTQLRRLLDNSWSPPDRLRFVLVGGAPAPPSLVERAVASDVPICPTYGTTETASQISTARPGEAASHPETVGRPLLFTDVTIVDSDGEPQAVGESGELVVDGPTVSPGYLDETRTAEAFGPDGLHTGDRGRFTTAGRLEILGRLDDRIITGGETVHPETVAAVLREHPGVEDAAVVGVTDPTWGERVAALVVADSVSAETLIDHCRQRLAGHEVPKQLERANSLPRTASGTIDRNAVRDRLVESG